MNTRAVKRCLKLAFPAALGLLALSKATHAGAAAREAYAMLWVYLREYMLFALLPALLISGAIAALLDRGAILRYLGPGARRWVSHMVAAVSGGVMAVCSCAVLPLFAGIRRAGAGLGPAATFLYAGPAVNILAITLTARVLGLRLGVARAVAAVVLSLLIGFVMGFLDRRMEAAPVSPVVPSSTGNGAPRWRRLLFLAALCSLLVMMNWAQSGDMRAVFLCCPNGLEQLEEHGRVVSQTAVGTQLKLDDGDVIDIPPDRLLLLTPSRGGSGGRAAAALRGGGVLLMALCAALMLRLWFHADERRHWREETWLLARSVVPLLVLGVLVSGFLLGRPGREALVPGRYIAALLGERPDAMLLALGDRAPWLSSTFSALWPPLTCLVAAIVGALMYFATLTEVPILQGLMGAGMGEGPALALLLAGPAMSLPNMLVIGSVIGVKRTAIFAGLVVLASSLAGWVFMCLG